MKLMFAIGLVALCFSPAIAASAPASTTAIKLVQQRQAEAWNTHDAKAYSDLFATDAHIINVLGWHWTSQLELRQKLGRAFASVFAKSQMTIEDISVDFLKPDIAVAHVRWSMTGALSPTGSSNDVPQHGIQTQVLLKRGGAWKICDFQNTNSVPEQQFPAPR